MVQQFPAASGKRLAGALRRKPTGRTVYEELGPCREKAFGFCIEIFFFSVLFFQFTVTLHLFVQKNKLVICTLPSAFVPLCLQVPFDLLLPGGDHSPKTKLCLLVYKGSSGAHLLLYPPPPRQHVTSVGMDIGVQNTFKEWPLEATTRCH